LINKFTDYNISRGIFVKIRSLVHNLYLENIIYALSINVLC
jgi:hypothetical protein